METALERARAGNALRGVSEEVLEAQRGIDPLPLSPKAICPPPPWPGRRPGRRPKSGPAQRQLGPIQRTDPGDMYWEMHLRPALRAKAHVETGLVLM